MKVKKIVVFSLLLSCLCVFQFISNSHAETSGAIELVGLLTDQLGVTQDQATGGAGALFKMAKDNLSENDFGTVKNALRGIDTLMQSAPEVSGSATGLSEKIGGVTK